MQGDGGVSVVRQTATTMRGTACCNWRDDTGALGRGRHPDASWTQLARGGGGGGREAPKRE